MAVICLLTAYVTRIGSFVWNHSWPILEPAVRIEPTSSAQHPKCVTDFSSNAFRMEREHVRAVADPNVRHWPAQHTKVKGFGWKAT